MANSGAPPAGINGRWIDRRRFLRHLGGLGLVAGVTACGSDDEAVAPTATPVPSAVAPTPTQGPIASPVSGYLNPTRWIGRTLTVASLGGYYQDAQDEAMFTPFAESTGAEVQQKLVGGDLGTLRQQVEKEQVLWDVVDLPTEEVLPLARGDYLTPIDYQTVDQTPLTESLVMQHGVSSAVFSTVLCYRPEEAAKPDGWGAFWDSTRYPGGRTLRRGPVGTLEFALLADGVPIDELYPLDVERAFQSLDHVRAHVVQWYDNTKQPIALLLNGDVTFASTFSVRASPPEVTSPMGLQWRGGMLSSNSWVIPRGAANRDVAMDFVNFATRAQPTANLSRLVPFGPVNRSAFELLRDDRLALMPNTPARAAVQFVENWAWWADNREELDARFEDWRLADPVPTEPATPADV